MTTPISQSAPDAATVPTATDDALRMEVVRVAQTITPIIAQAEPHVATLALLTVAATAAQATQFSREHLHGLFLDAYDKTKATFDTLRASKITPDQIPAAELEVRMKRVQEYAKDNPNADPAVLMKMLAGQA